MKKRGLIDVPSSDLVPRESRHRSEPTAEAESILPPLASPIAALPTDLLVFIFRHFRFHPLMRIVSLVSRKWRAAALRSVTSVCIYKAEAADILRLFPSLTAVQLNYPIQTPCTVRLPPGVRRLCATMIRAQLDVEPPRSFTHIAIGRPHPGCQSLLHASRDSLEFLRLGTTWNGARDDSCLIDLHFPALRSLSVSSDSVVLYKFVAAHASQLTALESFSPGPGGVDVSRLHYPALRRIRVLGCLAPVWDAPLLEAFAERTEGWTDIASLPPTLLTLNCKMVPTEPDLKHLPKLRNIMLTTGSKCFPLPVCVSERLVSLTLSQSFAVPAPALAALTRLCDLTIHFDSVPSEPIALPCLRQLLLVSPATNRDALIPAAVSRFIPSCTRLVHLQILSFLYTGFDTQIIELDAIMQSVCALVAQSPLERLLVYAPAVMRRVLGERLPLRWVQVVTGGGPAACEPEPGLFEVDVT